MDCSENLKRFGFEWVVAASNRDPLGMVLMMGSVWCLPSIRFLTNCFYARCESIPTVLGCCSILSGGSKPPFRWKMAPLSPEKEERHKVQ